MAPWEPRVEKHYIRISPFIHLAVISFWKSFVDSSSSYCITKLCFHAIWLLPAQQGDKNTLRFSHWGIKKYRLWGKYFKNICQNICTYVKIIWFFLQILTDHHWLKSVTEDHFTDNRDFSFKSVLYLINSFGWLVMCKKMGTSLQHFLSSAFGPFCDKDGSANVLNLNFSPSSLRE